MPIMTLVAADSATPVGTATNPLVTGGVVGTAVAASSGNVAAATATATLAASATKTTYISGFEITGGGATGASVIIATITGLLGGTLSYNIPVPAGATLGIVPLQVVFNPPLPGSAINTAIVVSSPTFGAGNTNAAVNAHGFQL